MSWFRRNRARLLVTFLLGISLLMFLARMRSPSNQNWLDRTMIWLSSPLQNAIVWTIEGTVKVWKNYVYLVGVNQENERLKKELEQLQRTQPRIQELESENQRLRQLVGMKKNLEGMRVVAARVVGIGTSPITRIIRVNVGADQGIRVGDAVVGSLGLVGKVSSVVGGYSQIELLVDSRSTVDVIIEDSRDRAMIRGRGEDEVCTVDYLRRTATVQLGNRVVTSGIGGGYPSGLLVGTISNLSSPNVGVFREAELKPVESFQHLEEVLLVGLPQPVAGEKKSGL